MLNEKDYNKITVKITANELLILAMLNFEELQL